MAKQFKSLSSNISWQSEIIGRKKNIGSQFMELYIRINLADLGKEEMVLKTNYKLNLWKIFVDVDYKLA